MIGGAHNDDISRSGLRATGQRTSEGIVRSGRHLIDLATRSRSSDAGIRPSAMLERGFSTQSFTRQRKASEVSETTNLLSHRFSWSEADDLRIDAYRVLQEADSVLPKEILPRYVHKSSAPSSHLIPSIEDFDAEQIWNLNYVEAAIYLEVILTNWTWD